MKLKWTESVDPVLLFLLILGAGIVIADSLDKIVMELWRFVKKLLGGKVE